MSLLTAGLAIGHTAGCQRSPIGPTEISEIDVTDGIDAMNATATTGTFYVAIQEAGADNTRCDGRSTTNRGGTRCPFRDFSSGRPLALLNGGKNLRIDVRRGTYVLPGGLTVEGTGNSEAGRLVLRAYDGESPVFDGGNVSREVLRVSGRYVTVQRLTIQNSAGYNLEVRGGQHVLLSGNRFLRNGASDSVKGDAGAADVVVRNNDFSRWDSQAIDLTGVSRWTIEGNRFSDPGASDANAIGVKYGSRDILIANNTFTGTGGLSLGGTSSAHPESFEAFNVTAQGNTFDSVPLFAFTLYSCSGCRLQGNDIRGAQAGVRMASVASMGASGCGGGCRASENLVASGNRFKNLVGNAEGPPDVFWAVDASETSGLASSGNVYCQSHTASGVFWYAGTLMDFSGWLGVVPGDSLSTLALQSDAACVGW